MNDPILNKNLNISSIIYSICIEHNININKTKSIFQGSNVFQNNKLTFKLEHPKSTICMTQSGYIRSMGTKTFYNATESINITINKLIENNIINHNINILKKNIENIVVSGSISLNASIEEIALFLNNSIYEPEQFPGLIYRPEKKIVMLLFASGKIVIVGGKSIGEINSAYNNLKEKLKKMR